MATEWDAIFTQDGPGKGLEPNGAPGWTGGDSTYSVLLPNGDTAFFFRIRTSANGRERKVTERSPNRWLRTTEINCPPPFCDPPASIIHARNSIVVLKPRAQTDENARRTEKRERTFDFVFQRAGRRAQLLDGRRDHASDTSQKNASLSSFTSLIRSSRFMARRSHELNPQTLAIERHLESTDLPDHDIHWGTAMIGTKATIFTSTERVRATGRKQMFVARAKPDHRSLKSRDVANWMVWDGSAWVDRCAKRSRPIIPPRRFDQRRVQCCSRLTSTGVRRTCLPAIDTTAAVGFVERHHTLFIVLTRRPVYRQACRLRDARVGLVYSSRASTAM